MSMKSSRMASEAAQSAKLRRLGAQGSTKLAKQGENAMRRYANGGMVMGDDEDEDEDMMEAVEGEDAMPRLDRPSRGKKDKDKKGGSTVNVIIMPGGGAGAAAGGPPMVPPVSAGPPPMPPPGPPMAGPPMGGPPMMPPGAGGPPMRKSGGSVNAYANGGKVKKADGGSVKAKHDDEAEDKKLMKSMVKGGCLK